jgi:DNA-directed RNA polymerase specialized sigma subunit
MAKYGEEEASEMDIARALNISVETVHQTLKTAIDRMRHNPCFSELISDKDLLE